MLINLSRTQIAIRRKKVTARKNQEGTVSIYGPNAQPAHLCCAKCAIRESKVFDFLRHLFALRL